MRNADVELMHMRTAELSQRAHLLLVTDVHVITARQDERLQDLQGLQSCEAWPKRFPPHSPWPRPCSSRPRPPLCANHRAEGLQHHPAARPRVPIPVVVEEEQGQMGKVKFSLAPHSVQDQPSLCSEYTTYCACGGRAVWKGWGKHETQLSMPEALETHTRFVPSPISCSCALAACTSSRAAGWLISSSVTMVEASLVTKSRSRWLITILFIPVRTVCAQSRQACWTEEFERQWPSGVIC
eukprot:1142380-Pelagomonas_calceolata.AAC.3